MLFRAQQRFNHWRFYRAAKGVLNTPAVTGTSDPVRIVSLICHRDLFMYLVAIKTFYRYVPLGRVTLLNDGTLTEDDKAILAEHVNPTAIINLGDVTYSGGRKGSRWEVLLTLAELSENHYVIQLDSDTVTVGDLPQVTDAIRQNSSFILATDMGQEIWPARRVVDLMANHPSQHVQAVAERNLDKLPDYETMRYVRGNAGLVGLGQGAFPKARAEAFLGNMTRAIGAKWYETGSLQTSSNFAVANAPGAFVLPLAEYRYYKPTADMSAARFIHFIGEYRFVDNAYRKVARDAVKSLSP